MSRSKCRSRSMSKNMKRSKGRRTPCFYAYTRSSPVVKLLFIITCNDAVIQKVKSSKYSISLSRKDINLLPLGGK